MKILNLPLDVLKKILFVISPMNRLNFCSTSKITFSFLKKCERIELRELANKEIIQQTTKLKKVFNKTKFEWLFENKNFLFPNKISPNQLIQNSFLGLIGRTNDVDPCVLALQNEIETAIAIIGLRISMLSSGGLVCLDYATEINDEITRSIDDLVFVICCAMKFKEDEPEDSSFVSKMLESFASLISGLGMDYFKKKLVERGIDVD